MENSFSERFSKQSLELIEINIPETIELKNHLVLFPPMPCCAQLAAPFWAKIIGSVENKDDKEYLIEIVIKLFDHNKKIFKECSEMMFLENGKTGEFDIQIPHLIPCPSMYSIKINIIEEV
ncbi:MAG: hypothetical protein N2596_04265 [Syntrophorhabdaceae bacterium]|nr:hypothetical protein [Syntrophorhabdaceae bacterium]